MNIQRTNMPKKDNKPCVTCRWMQSQKIVVNPDGQVVPCCYLANSLFSHSVTKNKGRQWQHSPILQKYIENIDDYNLNNKTITEILTSDWFNKDLPESWESRDTIAPVCQTFCDNNYAEEEV